MSMSNSNSLDAVALAKYVSDGVDAAKAGRAAEVYAVVAPYFEQGLLPLNKHYAFGWIIYYALHQAPDHDIAGRKHLLARYLNLSVPKPHKLHSMILTQAIRLYKDAGEAAFVARKNHQPKESIPTFSILRFANLWNLANLREGDWRRKEKDGQMMNSTVEKLLTACADELEATRTAPGPEIGRLFGKALEEYAASDSIHAQAATLHQLAGNPDAARNELRTALLLSPSKFYLWSRLAALIDRPEDIKLRIAMLHRALTAPGQEEFKGKVRLALAEAWLSINAFGQALHELQTMKGLYERNGWHLSQRFNTAMQKIPEGSQPIDPSATYRRIAPMADEYLHAALAETPVKKTYHKPAGETTDRYGRRRQQPVAWRVTDAEGKNYWFTPSRHGLDDQLPADTALLVKIHEGKIVAARLSK